MALIISTFYVCFTLSVLFKSESVNYVLVIYSLYEKVNSVIKSWTFFSKGLSFIGRVLVVNSLCASQLWYIIGAAASTKLYIVPSKGIH